jgi:hypothetical protein
MEWVDRALGEQPGHFVAIRSKVALCGHLGRIEEGRKWVSRLRELLPTFTIASFAAYAGPIVLPEVVAIYAEGLRRAGVPEE